MKQWIDSEGWQIVEMSDQELAAHLALRDGECLCWVGHGGCGGCSGVIGITHEPACGWEQHPDCPVHPPQRRVIRTPGNTPAKETTWS